MKAASGSDDAEVQRRAEKLVQALDAKHKQFQREKDIAEGKRTDDAPAPITLITSNFAGTWKTAKTQAEALFKSHYRCADQLLVGLSTHLRGNFRF